jgi:CubicO group peptidase (beta-lactamase class C family)/peptidoglycan/LPS O-acetylase OafA/YrhL
VNTSAGGRAGGSGEREGFLDAVRAVAIVRVVAWHTFGFVAITYVVAAMPAMFFVTGSLLAKSLGRRRARTVLADRFRRLLVPLWAFGLVAWAAMAVAARQAGTDLPVHRIGAWVVPAVDPQGTDWEGGWLSSHLWYLRTLVWLLLLSPLLLRAVRAWPRLTLAVPLAAVFALDLAARSAGGGAVPGHRTAWVAGDLALYSVFLLAGFLHRDGALRHVTRRGWMAVAVVAAAAAAAWRLTQPVPLGVVNNSHPLHLFVGAGWLAVAMAAQGPLARLAAGPAAGAVRAIGRRSLTVYLWHTAAIIVAVNVLEARGVEHPVAHAAGLLALTTLGILAAVRLFGWVEDVAAGRRPRAAATTPRPAPAPARPRLALAGRRWLATSTLAVLSGTVLALPSVSPSVAPDAAAAIRPSRRPPIPSQPPPPPAFRPAAAAAPATGTAAPVDAPPEPGPEAPPAAEDGLPLPGLLARLDGVLARWREETGVPGAVAGVAAGGEARWTGSVGIRPDTGQAAAVTDPLDLSSLTKLFTAVLVHRLADAGLVDLRAPLPDLASLPDFPYWAGITPEHLLEHRSGLVSYRETWRYEVDPASVHDPVSGVAAALEYPLAAWPGEEYAYSSTNYLVLGLLVEELTGTPLADLFAAEVFGPMGLAATTLLPPVPGEPRGGTAGVLTTLDDLLSAGVAILRDGAGLSPEAFAHLTAVDLATGYGPGTFGFCPCRTDEAGDGSFFALGYYGSTAVLVHAPAPNLTIAVDLTTSLWEDDRYEAVIRLFELVEEAAAGG